MGTSRKTRGLTFIEILVIVSIIGMLLALLLPATQSHCGTGSRGFCANQERQIALALSMYEQHHGHYPGYVNNVNGKRASWAVPLLEYIEEPALWEEWSQTDRSPVRFVKPLVCWSDPRPETENPLSYVINCGNDKMESAANGVCHNLYQDRADPLVNAIRVSLGYIAAHDGSEHTLLISENLQTEPWCAPFSSDAEVKRWTGFVWFDQPLSPSNRINEGKESAPRPTVDLTYSRPSSNHPGGVNAAFCDVHVKFISDDVDYDVYKQLMTPDSAAADDSVKVPLRDDAY